jgi:uncharacterized SAM-binding protein YcdF (DUF218 family)
VSRKPILTTILFATALLLALFLWRGGHWLVVETPLQQADAIVMLRGGSPERELEVADLYHDNIAELILFADFNSHNTKLLDSIGVDQNALLQHVFNVFEHLDVDPRHIHVIDNAHSSTRGEAIAVREYLESAPHIQTIIIVSSPPHMRRTRLIFRRELRKLDPNVELILRPSNYSDFQANAWYRHRESARAVVLEYLKIVGWVFRL